MTVQDLINLNLFQLKNAGDDLERDITGPFCCDLLSVAMGKAPAGCAWVTVMANINTGSRLFNRRCLCHFSRGCLFRRRCPRQGKNAGNHPVCYRAPDF